MLPLVVLRGVAVEAEADHALRVYAVHDRLPVGCHLVGEHHQLHLRRQPPDEVLQPGALVGPPAPPAGPVGVHERVVEVQDHGEARVYDVGRDVREKLVRGGVGVLLDPPLDLPPQAHVGAHHLHPSLREGVVRTRGRRLVQPPVHLVCGVLVRVVAKVRRAEDAAKRQEVADSSSKAALARSFLGSCSCMSHIPFWGAGGCCLLKHVSYPVRTVPRLVTHKPLRYCPASFGSFAGESPSCCNNSTERNSKHCSRVD
mmetsp:Transcript_4618/g.11191  ORF Transcript_4618/g.11191 Transcript_4618/m.11191 type:complete len:257 (+) Transcript_4618:97-867(+)